MGYVVHNTARLVALCFGLWFSPAFAGTNVGFSATLDPTAVRGPSVGQRIDLAVGIEGAVEANHSLVVARYDSSLIAFVEFTAGDLIEGLVV